MVEVVSTDDFDKWLRNLKDKQGKLRILERIDRLAHGNPGDVKPVGVGPVARAVGQSQFRQVHATQGRREGARTRWPVAIPGG